MASSHWQNQTHGLQSENRNPVTSYSHLTCFSRMMPPAPSLTLSPEQKEELWGGGPDGESVSPGLLSAFHQKNEVAFSPGSGWNYKDQLTPL